LIKKFLKKAQDIEHHRIPHDEEGAIAPPEEGEGNWLISYADMMTLLCGFFVMLFSMARMDEPKYEAIREAMTEQFGGKFKSPTKELASLVTNVLEESGIEKDSTVRVDNSGISVSFHSKIFFDTLSSEIRPEGKQILEKLLVNLKEKQEQQKRDYKFVIEGHTDSRPITGGIFPSNWELAGARSSRVLRLFLEKGYSSDKLTSISYADTRPELEPRLADGRFDENALSKNRRVVIRILAPGADSIPFPEAPAKEGTVRNPASSAH
jgi:chemotaxis protein MotB